MAENTAGGGNFYRMGQQMGPEKLDTSTADMVSGIGQQISTFGSAIAEERKEEAKKLKEERNAAGDKISQEFTNLSETISQLPQESFQQAQNECEDLRYRMYECIDAKDIKCQQNLMLELNKIKERHAGDADNLKTFVDSWQKDEDGNMPVSTDAMSREDVDVMENFLANDSKRTVYRDGQMYYEWDMDTGEVDENGEPITEPQTYSLQELQDKVILKETVNGNKYIDLEGEIKQGIVNGTRDIPTHGEMKRKIGEIIPRDNKAIRDWLHGNPAEQHDLNVEGYLIDLMERDLGTFSSLGMDLTKPEYAHLDKDNPKDGVQADEVPQKFKDKLIKNVMNVKDLEITHGILTDIYAARGLNNILGVPEELDSNGVWTGKGNKNYNKGNKENNILGMDDFNPNEQDAKNRAKTLQKLTALDDSANLKQYEGMSIEAIANKIGVDPKGQILNPKTGQMESVSTYIANAANKKATVAPTGNMG
jgi:hypothetical protein|tara:strand:+ start:176 stop:1612 length:1437 start_codon:yes stop_codon:yes gene_type:complete